MIIRRMFLSTKRHQIPMDVKDIMRSFLKNYDNILGTQGDYRLPEGGYGCRGVKNQVVSRKRYSGRIEQPSKEECE
jgi:hypothetical protein